MDFFIRFLFDFMSQFFNGLLQIITNIGGGIAKMVDIPAYINIIKGYQGDIKGAGWILVVLVILVFVILIALMGFIVFLIIRKYVRVRKTLVEQESLLEEVADLNRSVLKLTQEKDKILAMKVRQLGPKPGESSELEISEEREDGEKKETKT